VNLYHFIETHALRQRLSQHLGRLCLAHRPTTDDPGKTRMCGAYITEGYYCRTCRQFLGPTQENAA
jgi:hypothetical protein